VKITYSVSSRNNGKEMLSHIRVSRPTAIVSSIAFNDLNIRNIIIPRETLLRVPKIQKILVFIVIALSCS
jgi:hypothetical protein